MFAIPSERVSPPSQEDLVKPERRLVWLMVLRVTLISVLLGATLAMNYSASNALEGPSPRFLLGIIAASYLLTIVYSLWYRWGIYPQVLSRVQLTLDILLWGCLAYVTGGIASGFTFLLDLWVIVAAVILGGRFAFFTAGGGALMLAMLSVGMHLGLIPPLADQVVHELSIRGLVYFFGINVTALFLVAALVNSLVARLEFTGRGLEAERVRRADLVALHGDVIRSLTVGLATTNMFGEILGLNPAGLQMLGLKKGQAESKKLGQWLPELQSSLMDPGAIVIRNYGMALREDGEEFPVEYGVTPLLAADGTPHGSIITFTDLTQIRELEEQLEKSKRLAALGELGASLAHEIRNPLSAISGSMQMLRELKEISDEDRSLVQIVDREIKRMERLVNDMLLYVRPKPSEQRRINLGRLTEEVVGTFANSPNVKDRTIRVEVNGAVGVEADPDQMRQVLWNLLRNASQATRDGDVIFVRVTARESTVRLEVEDTGVGINEADLDKIFTPFFSTRERGLGLGLALCDRIVDEHGGKINVSSSIGEGTIFGIVLDRDAEEQTASTPGRKGS